MLLTTLYIIAITAEGMTGALAAGKHKMDLFGVIFIALVTAIGGGSIRDILLNHYPLTWVAHPEYVVLICIAALLTMKAPRVVARSEGVFLTLDAVVITGVFGGILRDILCMRIPLVFQKEIYAGIAIIAGAMYYALLEWTQLDIALVTILTLIVGVSARLLAIFYKLSLPIFSYEESSQEEKK